MPNNLESHVIIIIGKADAMKSRAQQIIDLSNETNTRIHNNQLSQTEIDALEANFLNLEESFDNTDAEAATMDGLISDIEVTLGI